MIIHRAFLLILLSSLIILSGCTETINVPPYSTSQFINRSTDLNFSMFVNGDYNGKILYLDVNKLSVRDINQLVIVESPIDTNAQTACDDDEFLRGDGTCQTISSSIDTNAQTACSGNEVLTGSGACVNVDALLYDYNRYLERFDFYNNYYYENDFFNLTDILASSGTWTTSNIEYSGYYGAVTSSANADTQLTFFGTGGGTGTTTNDVTTEPNSTRIFYWKGRWGVYNNWMGKIVIGHYSTATANVSNFDKMLGWYWDSNLALDQNIYGVAMDSAGGYTLTDGFGLVRNGQYEFLMVGNTDLTRKATGSSYDYYARKSAVPINAWTYLGTITTNIPSGASNFGIYAETITAGGTAGRIGIDYLYYGGSRDYYMQT